MTDLLLVVPAAVAALAATMALGLWSAHPEARLGRPAYALWLFWARLLYPAALLVFALALAGSWLLWLNVLAYFAQLYVFGIKTAERLQDAGHQRRLGLLTVVPVLGLLPAALFLALRPAGAARTWRVVPALPRAPAVAGAG
jgi:hypothetical protein